jgi:TctA family transporter
MEIVNNLILGFGVALTLKNLTYCFLGVFLGTLIGVLPGIGPLVTIAMLLPITFSLDPTSALIMLAGIFYGAQYGGSTTAILVNMPGETSSAVTAIDGYQMARQGRAGPALATAALASFFGGIVGTILIAMFGPLIGKWALEIGAAEYFSLMLMGLVAAAVLAHGDLIKSLAMVVIGLMLGLVGTDVTSGLPRFSFGIPELLDGVGFTVVAVGLFAVAEIVQNLAHNEKVEIFAKEVTDLMPKWADIKQAFMPTVRGTAIGSFFGALPGITASIASFSSYMVEKKLAKDPSRFGKGAIEGVAAPEAANNAAAQTHFIPDAHARHPGERHHGPDAGRLDHAGNPAGSAGDDFEARALLGPHRQHVRRQRAPRAAQPAPGRHLGAPHADPVPLALPLDHHVRGARQLQPEQQLDGRLPLCRP